LFRAISRYNPNTPIEGARVYVKDRGYVLRSAVNGQAAVPEEFKKAKLTIRAKNYKAKEVSLPAIKAKCKTKSRSSGRLPSTIGRRAISISKARCFCTRCETLWKNRVAFRWKAEVEEFNMPVKVRVDGKTHFIYPTSQWQFESLTGTMKENWQIATDLFYLEVDSSVASGE